MAVPVVVPKQRAKRAQLKKLTETLTTQGTNIYGHTRGRTRSPGLMF
jgi:hypothetical protein